MVALLHEELLGMSDTQVSDVIRVRWSLNGVWRTLKQVSDRRHVSFADPEVDKTFVDQEACCVDIRSARFECYSSGGYPVKRREGWVLPSCAVTVSLTAPCVCELLGYLV